MALSMRECWLAWSYCMHDNTDGMQHWVNWLHGSQGGHVPAAGQPWWAARAFFCFSMPMYCPG